MIIKGKFQWWVSKKGKMVLVEHTVSHDAAGKIEVKAEEVKR